MQRSSGRAHHDRTLLERDFRRQLEYASLGNHDEFRITAIAMFSNHLTGGAELLQAAAAIVTLAAGHQIMHTHSVPGTEASRLCACGFYHSGDFMPQGQRQMPHR